MLEALFDKETQTWRDETGTDLDETVCLGIYSL